MSNVLAAVLSGVKGLHTTINGLGERAGNAPLASVQAILKDHFNALTNIDESRLNDVSPSGGILFRYCYSCQQADCG